MEARRQLSMHQSNIPGDINQHITIVDGGEVSPGGAPTHYEIAVAGVRHPPIIFHAGSVEPEGPNGHTLESLLAISHDRLDRFQRGPFACPENQQAMDAIYLAISALKRRSRRMHDERKRGTQTRNAMSRIQVTDAEVKIGEHSFHRARLDRWDVWTSPEFLGAVRGLKPSLTTEELGVLQTVPRTLGGQNGLTEFQQVLTQLTPIQLREDDHVDDGK